jgi:hypothetical protein
MDKSDFPGQWAEMQLLTLVVVGKQHCRTDSQRKGWEKAMKPLNDVIQMMINDDKTPKKRPATQRAKNESQPKQPAKKKGVSPSKRGPGRPRKGASAVASCKEVAPKNNRVRVVSDEMKEKLLMAWGNIHSHKYAKEFRKPVKESNAPGYYDMINKPMDLGKIKQLIEVGQLTTFGQLQKEMGQIVANTTRFNGAQSDFAFAAEELKTHSIVVVRKILSAERGGAVDVTGVRPLRPRGGEPPMPKRARMNVVLSEGLPDHRPRTTKKVKAESIKREASI